MFIPLLYAGSLMLSKNTKVFIGNLSRTEVVIEFYLRVAAQEPVLFHQWQITLLWCYPVGSGRVNAARAAS